MAVGPKLNKPLFRTSRPEDAIAFFGRPIPGPWFGIAAEVEGVVVGLAGVVWRGEEALAFLNCPQRYMPPPLRSHRLARAMLAAARAAGEPAILAAPTPGIPTARRWLTALGFRFARNAAGLEIWKA
jgi:hypothetical protein